MGIQYAQQQLHKLYRNGTLGWIDSVITQRGGRPRIYYTLDD
jgi:hypothetical protein